MITLEMDKVYEDEYFSISIDEEEKLLYYKIMGYPKFSEVIRHGHDELFKIAHDMKKTHKLTNLVADLTEAKILLTMDIKFIGTVSYPRLAKNGLKNLAILLSDDIHVKINVQKTLEYMGPGVFQNVMLHPSLESAKEWFKTLS